MRRALVLVVVLAACSQPTLQDSAPPALLDLWTTLDVGTASLDGEYTSETCNTRFGTYFSDIGLRGLACAANAGTPLGGALGRYAGRVFTSGPHAVSNGTLALDLSSDQFGRYDPAFVAWAADNAIVGEDDAAVRALAQPIYDRHLQRLARVFWLVRDDLAADGFPDRVPAGVTADYAEYLDTGVVPASGQEPYYPGFSMYVFGDRNDGIARRLVGPGGAEYYSALYEANTAVGFWIRRRSDGTEAAFADALNRLLAVYDADWVASQG